MLKILVLAQVHMHVERDIYDSYSYPNSDKYCKFINVIILLITSDVKRITIIVSSIAFMYSTCTCMVWIQTELFSKSFMHMSMYWTCASANTIMAKIAKSAISIHIMPT